MGKTKTGGAGNDEQTGTGTDTAAEQAAKEQAERERAEAERSAHEAEERRRAEEAARSPRTLHMVRSDPAHPGGPTTADVHPDEVVSMIAAGWLPD